MPPKKVWTMAARMREYRLHGNLTPHLPGKNKKRTAVATKKTTTLQELAAAKKPATKKGAAAGSITADNKPAAKTKPIAKAAGQAPVRRSTRLASAANKKRKACGDEDDNQETEAPPAKKAKTTTTTTEGAETPKPIEKAATKKHVLEKNSAPKKTAAPKKPVAPKKTAADNVAAEKETTTTTEKTTAGKRKAADISPDDENNDDNQENEAPPAKIAKTPTTITPNKRAAPPKKSKSPAPKKAAIRKTTITTTKKATVAKAASRKTASTEAGPSNTIAGHKRKATAEPKVKDENEDNNENDGPQAKKTKTSSKNNDAEKPKKAVIKKKVARKEPAPKAPVNPALKIRIGVQINFAPTQPLDVFVFGEGSAGELGLGSRKLNGKMPIDVKRPRFNPKLSGNIPGVVQLACGGMHGIALTKDNKVLTWGVNDDGALGRNTKWQGGLRNAYDEDGNEVANTSDSDDDEESGLNPREATPTEIDMTNVAPGTKFVHVAATDSASFALTEDGRVYSWGTFRATEGVLGFNKDVERQCRPLLLTEPRKIVAIATGSNHVLTLDKQGKVQAWGSGDQSQLARRIVDRDARASALRPGGIPFKRGTKISKIAAGSYHSFAVTMEGQVYAWGLNNFGELGVDESMGADGGNVLQPTLVECLLPYKIVDVAGGEHHSVALTEDGKVLVWGRVDGNQCGFERVVYDRENCLYDGLDAPRILRVPTAHESLPGPAAAIAVGTDTTIVVLRDGAAWSWGFNTTYQCGQGETGGEVFPPRAIDNSVVRERKIAFAGCGGQFSMLASRHEE